MFIPLIQRSQIKKGSAFRLETSYNGEIHTIDYRVKSFTDFSVIVEIYRIDDVELSDESKVSFSKLWENILNNNYMLEIPEA